MNPFYFELFIDDEKTLKKASKFNNSKVFKNTNYLFLEFPQKCIKN
jgi:hypothetical protein